MSLKRHLGINCFGEPAFLVHAYMHVHRRVLYHHHQFLPHLDDYYGTLMPQTSHFDFQKQRKRKAKDYMSEHYTYNFVILYMYNI